MLRRFFDWVSAKNASLAAWGTRRFGTMGFFWFCFVYGAAGALPRLAPYQPVMLYWSNWVQLWALPLLMVGDIVLHNKSEARAQRDHEASEIRASQDHAAILEELALLRRIHRQEGELRCKFHEWHER